VGLDPAVHIVNGNKKDNFWMMGETGPCGPCSELHIDLTPAGDTKGALVNMGSAECIEIWNLVFIQFNANPDGSFSPLPAQHVDTGMGFERVTSIIQGTKEFSDFTNAKISNYETDIFRPIFDEIEKLSGKTYGCTLPQGGATHTTEQEKVDIAFRVVADHIRTLSFAIADGIQPGNTDRNYVLRRILRRAVRYGRTLGFHQPFFYKLVDVLARTMGDVFPELRSRQKHVEEVLEREEKSFNRTLDRGIQLFEQHAAGAASIPGAFAFELYDTYGFPLDLTELMARERGLPVDTAGFEVEMEKQKSRARAAQKKTVIELSEIETKVPTQFIGYDQLETLAKVLEVVALKDKTAVILDTTTAYAEMGGQVGDTGELVRGADTWRISNTQKSGQTYLHFLEGVDTPEVGTEVTLGVEFLRRRAIERHHTVTHLLHWALHEVVSHEATQKGSFVGPDKLTFDFNSAALTPAQVRDIERLVNEKVIENTGVAWTEVPYAEVRGRADIMQFFGDKYGETVRVVDIGGYSKELCAGTHTRATGEIGLFRINAEAAIAAGVRRIEAVAGLNAYDLAAIDTQRLSGLATKVGTPLPELEKRIEGLLAQQKELEKALKAAGQREAAGRAKDLLAGAETINGIPAIVADLGAADGDTLQTVADALKSHGFQGVTVLGGTANGAVALVAAVSPDFIAKAQAGKIIGAIAPLVGGKGGGKPEGARGGGKDPSKLAEALAHAKTLL
jgi:alanyl-tRNA synthetase